MMAAGRQALRTFQSLAGNSCIPDHVLSSVSGGYAFSEPGLSVCLSRQLA